MKEPDLLAKAAQHMQERAATYDKPEGERSMGRAVAAFNAITGRDLTEPEGWLLLQVLKDVRLFQRPGYHAVIAALSACGKKEEVSFDTLETARSQGKANAEFNAQVFRAAAPQYANTAIIAQTDSSMTPECPQGDGWASVKLVDKENPAQKVGLKCSTVSGSVGCLLDTDFQTKSYAGDDGRCRPTSKTPFPLPKIAK